jgi:hypothetical protein
VLFSGAARHANDAAGAGYFADSGGESIETGLGGGASGIRTLGAARVSMGEIRPEFGALFGATKASVLERNLFA